MTADDIRIPDSFEIAEESGMKLRHSPRQLKVELDKLTLTNWAEQRPNWRKYLYLENTSSGDSKYTHVEQINNVV